MKPLSPRRKDSGFALLLVFLMAAIAALMLYRELPRIAFQSQRQKEQLLMERGQEYQHAIGLFMRSNSNRWPASFDELESFNNKRYLRRRYKDPMTGKDEWRLIHINNGVLTDSVNNKPPNTQQTSNNPGIVADIPLFQNNGTGGGVNPAMRRRPSDGGVQTAGDGFGGIGGMPGQPGQPGQPGMPGQPGATGPPSGIPGMGAFPGGVTAVNPTGPNGVPGGVPAVPGIPGIPVGANGQPVTSGQNGASQNGPQSGGGLFGSGGGGLFGSAPTTPTAGAPGQPGVPGQSPLPGQPFAQPGVNGTNAAGAGQIAVNPQAQAAAAGLIQGILTTPRPGGLAGIQAAQQQSGNTVGGGIAGVASKYDADSIMVYADKQNYAEWEFIYDPSKYHRPPQPTSSVSTSTPNTGGVFGNSSASGGSGSSSGTSATPQIPGQASGSGGSAPSPFGNSFSAGSAPMGGLQGSFGSPPGAATGTSPMGTPGMPGAQGAPGQAVMPGGSSAFGGGGGPDIRPGRAN